MSGPRATLEKPPPAVVGGGPAGSSAHSDFWPSVVLVLLQLPWFHDKHGDEGQCHLMLRVFP